LPKIHGLSFEEYEREVRRRFALGGQYSSSVRDETSLTEARRRAAQMAAQAKAKASEDKRSSARLMRARGMSLRAIAAELGVSHEAVREWCK
jgi:DNA-directed RNA polymerase specialized sigma24 family protein